MGYYCWFLVRGMPVRDDSGQIVRWFGTCTDIEDQKHIEHALRESREELVVDIDEQRRIEEALRESQERASVLMNSSFIGITGLGSQAESDPRPGYGILHCG